MRVWKVHRDDVSGAHALRLFEPLAMSQDLVVELPIRPLASCVHQSYPFLSVFIQSSLLQHVKGIDFIDLFPLLRVRCATKAGSEEVNVVREGEFSI